MHWHINALEVFQAGARLPVATIFVIDHRFQYQGFRKQVAQRLLVLTDPIIGPGGLEKGLQPLFSSAFDLVVIVNGIAVLLHAVVGAGQLHEGQLAGLLVHPRLGRLLPRRRSRGPDHFLHRLQGGGEIILAKVRQPFEVLGSRIEGIAFGNGEDQGLHLVEALAGFGSLINLIQCLAADEVVARQEVAELSAKTLRKFEIGVLGDLLQNHRFVGGLVTDEEKPLQSILEEFGLRALGQHVRKFPERGMIHPHAVEGLGEHVLGIQLKPHHFWISHQLVAGERGQLVLLLTELLSGNLQALSLA